MALTFLVCLVQHSLEMTRKEKRIPSHRSCHNKAGLHRPEDADTHQKPRHRKNELKGIDEQENSPGLDHFVYDSKILPQL